MASMGMGDYLDNEKNIVKHICGFVQSDSIKSSHKISYIPGEGR